VPTVDILNRCSTSFMGLLSCKANYSCSKIAYGQAT